jgi:5-formyltetrahydrofolate cyclo-ligase
VNNNKSALRRQLLQQRRELSSEIWREWSDRICRHLLNYPQFQRAKTILVYQSCNQETDLSYLFTHANQQWGLPRCVGKELIWHRWQTSESLIIGAYGILEPAPELPQLEPDLVDLMLIPSIATDRAGYRLGYGGGYYDRLRADPLWQKIPSIGITFDFSYVETLPIDPWDIGLDAVCTELGVSVNNHKFG